MLTLLTMAQKNTVGRPYHHGSLRHALVAASRVEIERTGYETLSLRDLAAAAGVSEAAPYRHFKDKRVLLATLATEGFRDLETRALAAMARERTPISRMTAGARAYLLFADECPQLFRLMFVSDLLTAKGPRDPVLVQVANKFHLQFEDLVAGICRAKGDKTVKAAALAVWSILHGFALLRMGNRLMPFMQGPLSDDELCGAILAAAVASPASIVFPRGRSTIDQSRHTRRVTVGRWVKGKPQ